jgi:hypothetical protein
MARKRVSIGAVATELGLSPSYIRQMTSEGVFEAIRTTGGHRRYDMGAVKAAWVAYTASKPAGASASAGAFAPGLLRALVDQAPVLVTTVELDGLEEHLVWPAVKAALNLEQGTPAADMSGYTFLEMLNNAIDHSGGREATVRVWRDASYALVEILDDGVGVFARLMDGLELDTLVDAIGELSKGKRTTAPQAHTGQGIFFTSKLVEVFSISANGLDLIVDNIRQDVAAGVSSVQQGTQVRMLLDPATSKDVTATFREYTDEDLGFTRSRPTVKLFELGLDFVSRSEARRLLVGMEEFTEVRVDFAGVRAVGQGFVDELVRVWPSLHPETAVSCVNMNEAVEWMVKRGLPRS